MNYTKGGKGGKGGKKTGKCPHCGKDYKNCKCK